MSHEPRHVRDAAPAASDSPVVLGNNTRIYRSTRGDRASSSQSVVSAGSGDALPVGTDHGGSDRRAPPRQRSGAGSGINSNNRGVGPGGMGNLRGVSGPPPTTPPHTPGRPFSARENMQPWSPSTGGGSGGGGGGAYSDRFIPSRSASNIAGLPLLDCPPLQTEGLAGVGSEREDAAAAYSQLLRTEYLGEPGSASLASPEKPSPSDAHKSLFSPARNIFRFKAESRCVASQSPYSLSPVGGDGNFGASSSSPRRAPRKIARAPFKVLDAPSLQDDFYLNLVDWSPQNQLAVGLGSCVYLWSACTSKVTKLCDLSSPADDTICSVAWSMRGSYLAVGTNQGEVQIWDPHKIALVRTMTGHRTRAGALAWGSSVLSSGSRDRTILQRDIRSPQDSYVKLLGHKSEVCGLKWSYDDRELASGGNDNHLFVWNASSPSPVLKFTEHTAAVKAISWSPHQHGLLASGGGTADRCIRFWNTTTNTALSHVDTGSQVCNLAWSKNVNEVVSTHGYSQNQIVVWRYPTMSKLATLTGHSLRVLYLAVSPDGQTIVTGAGDETLRFWNVFPGPKSQGSVHDYSMWSLGHTQIR